MALYKVKGIYYYDIGPRGPGSRRSTGTDDRAQAQELHDKFKAERWRHDKLGEDSGTHTWDEAAELWLSEPKDGAWGYRIQWLTSHLRGMSLDSLTPSVLEDIVSQRNSSPGNYNSYVVTILAVLNKAKRKGWLREVPRLEKKKVKEERVRWLSLQEWERLKKHLPRYLLQAARFTLATGLREQNVLRLEWSQVDLRRKVAWIHPDQAKARKAIGVPLNQKAMSILREQSGSSSRWVFPMMNGGQPAVRASSRSWYEALKKAGLEGDFTWHGFRHTWASWAIQSGVTLAELQKLGGWSSPTQVMRYAHFAPEHLAKASSKVKPIRRRA